MKKIILSKQHYLPAFFFLFLISFLLFSGGCKKVNIDKKDLRDFQQVNLVANSAAYSPVTVDPSLQNAWGLAFSPNGIAWVNSTAGHVSELYTGEGVILRPGIRIPSPADTIGGLPTGIVFAGGAGFKLANNLPAAFLFDGVDGVISGWNGPAGNNAFRIADQSATSAYTGLALARSNGANYLYAANFRAGRIDVWDTTFTPVSMSFKDPALPAGYSPFNIQAVASWLYVLYAKVGADGRDQAGAGLGFVDIFNTDGSFVKRFASRGSLNAPWGVAMSPENFLQNEDMSDDDGQGHKGNNNKGKDHHGNDEPFTDPVILIGNFGDGRINVYTVDGQFLGLLQSHNRVIAVDGLWALSFAPATSTIDPRRLYFTAGPNEEKDGLFGYFLKN